jgi:hypothetical protein
LRRRSVAGVGRRCRRRHWPTRRDPSFRRAAVSEPDSYRGLPAAVSRTDSLARRAVTTASRTCQGGFRSQTAIPKPGSLDELAATVFEAVSSAASATLGALLVRITEIWERCRRAALRLEFDDERLRTAPLAGGPVSRARARSRT